jgi:glycerol-3-phosphate dehydrogenase
VLGDAKSYKDLGDDFSGGLYQAEVEYLVENEFAKTAEDILWRRTKIGLKIDKVAEKKLKSFLKRIDNMPI